MEFAALFKELGLGIAMVIVMIYLFFRLAQWAMKLVKDVIDDLKTQRDELIGIIKGFNIVLQNHNVHAIEFGRETKEAFAHIRREHGDFLVISKEQTIAIGRINGFIKETE